LWVEAALADLGVDPLPKRAEVAYHLLVLIPTASEILNCFRCPIKKHPGHHLRMGKVPAPASHLPKAVVGALPRIFLESSYILKQLPVLPCPGEAHLACGVPAQ